MKDVAVPIMTQVDKKKYKQVEIYNANHEIININPLSDEQVKHTGSIVFNNDDFEDISLIRLQFNKRPFDFLLRPFYFLGKKRNISSYFSVNQFQDTILDIPMDCKLNELDFKIPMGYAEFCTVTVFDKKTSGMVSSPTNSYPNKEFYVVLRNDFKDAKEVNLIDLAQGKEPSSLGITVLNNDFNADFEKFRVGIEFGLMRVWTNKPSQFSQMVMDDNTPININNYFSASQFQSVCVDVHRPFVITPEKKLTVMIESGATAMYHFIG